LFLLRTLKYKILLDAFKMNNILKRTAVGVKAAVNALPSWTEDRERNIVLNMVVPAAIGAAGFAFACAKGYIPMVSTIDGSIAPPLLAASLGGLNGFGIGGALGITAATVGSLIKASYAYVEDLIDGISFKRDPSNIATASQEANRPQHGAETIEQEPLPKLRMV
jgi:hypothetical protein